MYQESVCKDFITKYLSDNTRHSFDDNDIKIKAFEAFECELFVQISHRIVIKVKERTSSFAKGELYSAGDYRSMVQQIIRDESKNPQLLALLYERVQSSEYGKAQGMLCELPQSFSYQSTCKDCAGKGFVKCTNCKGGLVNCSAWGCDKGRVKKKHKDKNGIERTYFEDCSRCRGTGKMECGKCKGNGVVDCRTCNASGTTITTASFECHIESTYSIKIAKGEYPFEPKEVIKTLYQEQLNTYGESSRTDVQQNESGTIEHYHIKIPFASCQTLYHSQSFEWRLYGIDMQVESDGGLLVYIFSKDLEAFKHLAQKPYLKPFLLIRSSKIIKTFMESKKNEEIFEKMPIEGFLQTIKLKKQYTKQEVEYLTMGQRELMGNICKKLSITQDYLRDTLESMYAITSAYCRVSRVWWFLFAPIFFTLAVRFAADFFEIRENFGFIFISSILGSIVIGWLYRKLTLRIFLGKVVAQWVDKAGLNKLYFWRHIFAYIAFFIVLGIGISFVPPFVSDIFGNTTEISEGVSNE
ncbi:hypothetical protein OQH61_05190 [Helicobacter sp. MIT 21-1697]|uniref:hypothetical protein n=1 Tax=Helicobacter sp. MIT 21-1697 TaxID=2993733 RepID=UPI00224AC68E|nr:hypothetical protein [Helicobacter sp. MIT 21-1697]MCX2717127.1 hypothetical protein [Helicobacter sp. MIT 21-1697]